MGGQFLYPFKNSVQPHLEQALPLIYTVARGWYDLVEALFLRGSWAALPQSFAPVAPSLSRTWELHLLVRVPCSDPNKKATLLLAWS